MKPKCILLLQALCLIQLVIVAIGTSSAIVALPSGFPASDALLGLIKPALGASLVLGLLLSLQRAIPRSKTVAPVMAGLWWLLALVLAVAAWHDGHQSALTLAGKLTFYAGLLWLLVLVFADEGSQAYLARASGNDDEPKS